MITAALLTVLVLMAPVPGALVFARGFHHDRAPYPVAYHVWLMLGGWLIVEELLVLSLGAMGLLSRTPVMIAHAAVFAGGIAALRFVPRPQLPAMRLSRFWCALCGAPLSVLIALTLSRQTNSYDSLMYHYPLVATWLQEGGFARFTQWYYISCFPCGYEAYLAPFMLATGNDQAALLPNLIIAAYLGLGLWLIARELGAEDLPARAAALLACSVTLIPVTLRGAHADVPVAAFMAGALLPGLLYRRTLRLHEIVLAGCNAGLLVGAKMSGPGYVAVAGLFAVLYLAPNLLKRVPVLPTLPSLRVGVVLSLLFLAGAGFIGGFWYFRNWLAVGNPLGFVPIQFGPLGFPVDTARVEPMVRDVARGSLAAVFEAGNLNHWAIVGTQVLERWGLPLLVLLAAVLLAFVPGRKRSIPLPARIALVAFAGICVYLYSRSPFTADNGGHGWQLTHWMGYQMRYGLPTLLFLVPLAACGMERLPRRIVTAIAVLAVAWAALFSLIGTESSFAFPKILATPGGLSAWAVENQLGHALPAAMLLMVAMTGGLFLLNRGQRLGVVMLAPLFGLALAMAWNFPAYQASRGAAGKIQGAVNQLVPPGAKVAYLDSHRATFFWRDGYDNRVKYLPGTSDDPGAWAAALDAYGADFIAMGPPVSKGRTPQEFTWLTEGPLQGRYQLVHGRTPYTNAVLFARVR